MLFQEYNDQGQQLIELCRNFAVEALKDVQRSDGSPFIKHPDAVARIVAGEVGLPPECVAAVYLHEAGRFKDADIRSLKLDESIYTMVDGLRWK